MGRVPDCRGYTSGSPRCAFERPGVSEDHFNCTGNYEERSAPEWGVESGHFLVWARINGLPTFQKPWARLDTPLEAGSVVRVYFEDNFPVRPFLGRKSLILTTASVLGGRNEILGYGYLTIGGCCFVFGLLCLWKHLVN